MTGEKGDILTQRPARLGWARQLAFGGILLCLPALAVVTAFGVAPGSSHDLEPRSLVAQPVPLPELAPIDEPAATFTSQDRILRGDTVAVLLDRLGVRDPKAVDFMRSDGTARTLYRQLVPGRTLQAETGPGGELRVLRYFLGATSLLEVTRQPEGFTAKMRALSEPPRLLYGSGEIRSSLFAATDAAGIPDAIAAQIARVFATDIDFHSDLRKGDRFSVVYEMLYEAGELVAPGRIVAAEFVNEGRAYHAVLFRDDEGGEGYYSLDGANRAKAFLRSPVEFSRVSSGFGRRFHPIFKNWRAHTGVDFAAAHGTRVLATADGVVTAAGSRGGYGNAVEIRHGSGITTLYAHLSGFAKGVRAGARVMQGDPVGFVGATGFATGPHLHYEFKMGGVHQDPMRVALPKADPVPGHLRSQFMQVAGNARATIQRVSATPPARFE
jgi:murein DD-endopeptidase MepM/ murein hydrolase activator NlpD